MAYRSEANRIPNKINYQDLNLTHYPTSADTRLNNTNMRGFVNVGEETIPDFVMAEFVNAALDGVMALQRAVGTNPMVPIDIPSSQVPTMIETFTVSERIGLIEGGSLDERYGGPGWKYTPTRPTLSSHNHDGLNGHPGKIDLVTEVEGLLRKANIDLTQATGLTGGDIFVSKTNGTTIDVALNDMLSKTYGGTVRAKTNFEKGVRTLTTIEMLANEFSSTTNASIATDNTANFNRTMQATGSVNATVHSETLTNNLMFGQYVLGLRVKTSVLTSSNLIRIMVGDKVETFTGDEFDKANEYQMIYVVFNHAKQKTLSITKLATSTDITVSIDSFYIHPIHPAVFDR